MEVLYAFKYKNGYLVEVKNTSLPNTAPKDERFKWELKEGDSTVILDFESRTETTRKFKNGLELDIKNLVMKLNGVTYDLTDVKSHYQY